MNQYFVLAQGTVKTQTTAAPTQTVAQTTANGTKGAPEQQGAFGGIMGMLPMILIFAAMFYLMWRGQAKERKKREEMLSAIKAGDKIVTIGGLCGVVAEVKVMVRAAEFPLDTRLGEPIGMLFAGVERDEFFEGKLRGGGLQQVGRIRLDIVRDLGNMYGTPDGVVADNFDINVINLVKNGTFN